MLFRSFFANLLVRIPPPSFAQACLVRLSLLLNDIFGGLHPNVTAMLSKYLQGSVKLQTSEVSVRSLLGLHTSLVHSKYNFTRPSPVPQQAFPLPSESHHPPILRQDASPPLDPITGLDLSTAAELHPHSLSTPQTTVVQGGQFLGPDQQLRSSPSG